MTARPFRLTSVVREDEWHPAAAQLLRKVLLPPAEWTCFPAGHVPLPPEYAAKLSRMGLQRSWPDFQIVYGGRIFGIELKRQGGRLSKTKLVRTRRGALRELVGQDQMFPRLERAGMQIAVCHSVDDVMDALVAFGLPLLAGRIAA